MSCPATPAGILPRKERSLHGRNDDDAKNGPTAPFALRLLAAVGPSSSPARLPPGTPDDQVVPEYGPAA